MPPDNKKHSLTKRPEPSPEPKVPRVSSTDLLQGTRRLIIEHTGEDYSLRITKNNRLILNKI